MKKQRIGIKILKESLTGCPWLIEHLQTEADKHEDAEIREFDSYYLYITASSVMPVIQLLHLYEIRYTAQVVEG